ncbi:hypothetical protein [Paenibacillus mendelii]|uniref:Uncharacterized protein n=1 Tax=Paenibacillus mendelii TaxID=206163 RepID=A0ABV6JEN9_9BACL|nr:hypothetical protein [Paenibacillus mendelii]MCQ6562594.1 hypothetical protein [Paenibacillus mendelii]
MRRMSGNTVVLGLFAIVLVIGAAIGFYVYNQADYWHESKADIGPLEKRLHIVIEEAKKGNQFDIVHYEDVEGGMMVFTKKNDEADAVNLSVNYIRVNDEDKLEWAWGGEYGISSNTDDADLLFQYVGKNEQDADQPSPFPILYGDLFNPAIASIVISDPNGLRQSARIINVGKNKRIWAAYLPDSASGPLFTIEGMNRDGKTIAIGELKDGTMGMSKAMP